MTHPLSSKWTYYVSKQGKKNDTLQDYINSIKKISEMNTVEDFWAVHSHTKAPSYLPPNYNLHFFRGDSRAIREDNDNENGGTFLVKLSHEAINESWQRILLDLVREAFHPDVCGVVVHYRPNMERIVIWNKSAKNEAAKIEILRQIQNSLGLPLKSKVEYLAHKRTDGGKPQVYIMGNNGPSLE